MHLSQVFVMTDLMQYRPRELNPSLKEDIAMLQWKVDQQNKKY